MFSTPGEAFARFCCLCATADKGAVEVNGHRPGIILATCMKGRICMGTSASDPLGDDEPEKIIISLPTILSNSYFFPPLIVKGGLDGVIGISAHLKLSFCFL